MLRKIKKWFQRNGIYLKLLLLISIAAALTPLSLCLLVPGFFSTITSITPLAFLAVMNYPLALLTLSAITMGSIFLAIIGGILAKQLITIGEHVWALFFHPGTDSISLKDSTRYMQKNLKIDKSRSYESAAEEQELQEINDSVDTPIFAAQNGIPPPPILYDTEEMPINYTQKCN